MNIIAQPNAQVIEKIGLQASPATNYHRSVYMIQTEIDDGILLCNTMTQEIVWLPKEECAIEETNDYLFKHWFLIAEDMDEKSICSVIKNSLIEKPAGLRRLTGYTIFPTTGCNAACIYCYEAGRPILIMSDETAEKLAQFIKKSHAAGHEISLRWFGGEPLINAKVIRYVCTSLDEAKISYKSSMITNGILLDRFTDDEIKYLWKLTNVQITFEGTEEIHNLIKHAGEDVNAFQQSLSGVRKLLRCKVRTLLRLHVRRDNLDDMLEFLKYLDANVTENRNYLRAYAAPWFQTNNDPDEEQIKIAENCKIVEEEIHRLKLNSWPSKIPGFKSHHCMADNGTSICVAPDGNLTLCEHHFSDEIVGNLDKGISRSLDGQALVASWAEYCNESSCRECWCYPSCMRLKKCDPEPSKPAIGWCTNRKNRFFLTLLSVYNRWKVEIQNGKKTGNSEGTGRSRVRAGRRRNG